MKETENFSDNPISIEKTLDGLFDKFELNFDPKNLDLFTKAINHGAVPIIISNHQSLIDGVAITKVIEKVISQVNSEKLNGFYLPYAVSINTGDQDPFVTQCFTSLAEKCREKQVFLIPVVRKKDKEKYGIDEHNPLYINSQKSLKKIISLTEDKYGLAIFPEGTTQGGRLNKLGRFFGLSSADPENAVDYLIPKFIKKDIDFCVLPIGINGSCNLFSPDTYKVGKTESNIIVNIGDVMEPRVFKDNPKFSSNTVLTNIAQKLLQPEYVGSFFRSPQRVDLT